MAEINSFETLATYLNEKFDAIDKSFAAINEQFIAIDQRFNAMDCRFDAMDQRFDAMDQRFDAMDQRFDAMNQRFDAMDQRFDAMDQRFDAMDQRMKKVETVISDMPTKLYVSEKLIETEVNIANSVKVVQRKHDRLVDILQTDKAITEEHHKEIRGIPAF